MDTKIVEIPKELLELMERARQKAEEDDGSMRMKYYSPALFSIDPALMNRRFGVQ